MKAQSMRAALLLVFFPLTKRLNTMIQKTLKKLTYCVVLLGTLSLMACGSGGGGSGHHDGNSGGSSASSSGGSSSSGSDSSGSSGSDSSGSSGSSSSGSDSSGSSGSSSSSGGDSEQTMNDIFVDGFPACTGQPDSHCVVPNDFSIKDDMGTAAEFSLTELMNLPDAEGYQGEDNFSRVVNYFNFNMSAPELTDDYSFSNSQLFSRKLISDLSLMVAGDNDVETNLDDGTIQTIDYYPTDAFKTSSASENGSLLANLYYYSCTSNCELWSDKLNNTYGLSPFVLELHAWVGSGKWFPPDALNNIFGLNSIQSTLENSKARQLVENLSISSDSDMTNLISNYLSNLENAGYICGAKPVKTSSTEGIAADGSDTGVSYPTYWHENDCTKADTVATKAQGQDVTDEINVTCTYMSAPRWPASQCSIAWILNIGMDDPFPVSRPTGPTN
jgi:hypothetical protein